MDQEKLFAIIDWDDKKTNDIPLSVIRKPRKEEEEYLVGDRVEAKCTGYGFCWGVLAAIDADRTYLKSKLLGPRPVIDDRKNRKTEKNAPAQSPRSTVNLKHSSVQEGDSISSAKKQKRPIHKSKSNTSEAVDPDLPVIKKLKSRKESATPRPVKQKSPSDSESEAECSNEDGSDSDMDPPASTSTPKNKKQKAPANEGKTVKAEENKRKRLMKKDRDCLNLETSLKIIEPDSCSCSCGDNYKQLEGKVNKILQLLESFTDCKTCLKKAYKIATNEMPNGHMDKATKNDVQIAKVEEIKESVAKPAKEAKKDSYVEKREIIEADGNAIGINNESASESMLQSHDDSSAGEEEELEFVGAAKYGLRMEKEVLGRILKSSKNPEKLALGLLQPLLSEHEIQNCTMYGNQQFKKEPMNINKRRAIRSAVFDAFQINKSDSENEEIWKKITVSTNDKIRGLRNGKYKKQ